MYQRFGIRRFTTAINRRKLYKILDIDMNFTTDTLKKSYLKYCKIYHPDVNHGKTLDFLAIQKAYEILGNSVSRKKYDSMTIEEEEKFNKLWETQYNPNKEFGIDFARKFDKYKFGDNINKFIATISQKIYNKINPPPILYEPIDRKTNGRYSHICILLDCSDSMYNFDTNDRVLYIDKCVDNIVNILNDLTNKNTNQLTNMECFATRIKTLSNGYITPNVLRGILMRERDIHNQHFKNTLGACTSIYDALYEGIKKTDKSFLSNTLFVLFTDGADNNSNIKIDDLINEIKNNPINLVIMTLNLNIVDNLKKLIDAAKFGKLLKIGNKFEIPNISTAFKITKEIMLTEKDGNLKSYNDISKTFNL